MAVVPPPNNIGAVFTIQGDGSLRHMTGELGPQGAAGLGSGVVCLTSSFGSFVGVPVGVLISQIPALPPPLGRRFVVDMSTGLINTF
jgi:hypothetical protein